jgi:Replication-relaxation
MTDDKTEGRRYRQHHRRAGAGDKPGLVLQERDHELIQAVSDNRFLTRSLLVTFFPPDPARTPAHVRTAAPKTPGTNLDRRLAKLYHHGYLDRVRTVRGGELIYALAGRGAELLRTRQPELPMLDWAEKNRDLSGLYIEHALMVARFRAGLTAGLAAAAGRLLHFERERRDLKAEWREGGERYYVNPDAFFSYAESGGGGEQPAFLEADRSTMTLARLWGKYASYAAMYRARIHREAFGVSSFPRVLPITKSAERATNLLELVAGDDSPAPKELRDLFLFTTETSYAQAPTNILAAIWRSAAEPDTRRALIGSPLPRR